MNSIKKLLVVFFLTQAAATIQAGIHDVPPHYLPVIAWHYLRMPSKLLKLYNTTDIVAFMQSKKRPTRDRIESKKYNGNLGREDEIDAEYIKAKNRLVASALFGFSGFLAYLYHANHPDATLIKIITYGAACAATYSLTDSFYELYKAGNYKKHLKIKMKYHK